jgi:hypothetical protein
MLNHEGWARATRVYYRWAYDRDEEGRTVREFINSQLLGRRSTSGMADSFTVSVRDNRLVIDAIAPDCRD